MSDEQVDQQLREWGRAEREHAPTITMPELSNRHRPRVPLVLATAAAVVVVLAVVAAVLVVRSRSHAPTQAASGSSATTAYSPDTSRLVLHDGDTVTAAGEVLSQPGKPVRFCDPNVAEAAVGTTDPNAPLADCGFGIDVSGVDLSKLSHRKEFHGQVVGGATLTGVYRNQAISVTKQGPAGRQRPPELGHDHPPCSAPPGGWPRGRANVNLPFGAVERYKRAHPGAIIFEAMLRPSANQALVYLVTNGDPAPVRDALAPRYKERLCVVKSQYTHDQIRAAYHVVTAPMRGQGSLTAPTGAGGPGLNPTDEQPMIEAEVPALSQSFADAIDAQPAGLVQVTVWLAPHR
jgi:hypothetical protein